MNFLKITKLVESLKKSNKTIGLCHGVFDLLHYGHFLHLKAAKKKCDYLFVSITSEELINKGPNRPIHDNYERISILNNITFVDFAFVSKGKSGVGSINLIKPNFYFKGIEYKNNKLDKTKKILEEVKAVKKNKGKVVYTNEKEMSSSKIINQLNLVSKKEHSVFLKKVKKLGDCQEIFHSLNKLKKNKVLVIGDLIIDKYIFGDVLGKSGKEPHMVFREVKEEMYAGGASIVANHLSDFVTNISLITDLSGDKHVKKILNKKLRKNIKLIPIKSGNDINGSCIKTRFIDSLTKYKLYGSYKIPNLNNFNFYRSLNAQLTRCLKLHDIIIIADYSNNFFDIKSLKKIQLSKKFICGMSQKNSNNYNFHTLKNLKNFDLLCINEGELRSELRDNSTKLEIIAKNYKSSQNIKYLVVTQGKNGCILLDKLNKMYHCPSFNSKPVDKVGAGDSMLAILSVFLYNNINPYFSLLFASLVSSNVVEHTGNDYVANKIEIERSIEFMLK